MGGLGGGDNAFGISISFGVEVREVVTISFGVGGRCVGSGVGVGLILNG